MLKIGMLNSKASKFFDSLVHDTIKERQQKGIFRPDMLQLLMQVREGRLQADKEDAEEAEEVGAKRTKLDDDAISAQAIVFFFAGFETVSTAMCTVTYLLSHHEEVQKRVQGEIDDVMDESGGKPSYEIIQKMKYLDAVIYEALRMYPPQVASDRVCGKDIQLPGGPNSPPVLVRKGDIISIPIIGIHHDPQYWPEPEKFDPERFYSVQNDLNMKRFTFMPFGVGPRVCIGQRLALMEVKLALVHLLYNFNLHPKTQYPMKFKPGLNFMAHGGFWCDISPR